MAKGVKKRRIWAPFGQIGASLAMTYASGWLTPLENLGLGHPIWEETIRKLSLIIGAVLSLALFLLFSRTNPTKLKFLNDNEGKILTSVMVAFAVILILCLAIEFSIDLISNKASYLVIRDLIWRPLYFLFCVLLVLFLPAMITLGKKYT